MLRTSLKWFLGLMVGVFFVWLSVEQGRFDALEFDEVRLVGTTIVSGEHDPHIVKDLTSSSSGQPVQPGWHIDLRFLLAYLGFLIAIHVLRVVRWQPLLAPVEHVPLRTLNRIGAVGFMSVFLLPLRLGELVRPYLLSRAHPQIPFTTVLGTIALERLIDGLLVSLLLSVVLFDLPTSHSAYLEMRIGAVVAIGVFLGGITTLVFLWWKKEDAVNRVDRLVRRISSRVADVLLSTMASFLKGLQALPRWREFGAFILLTIVYWGINGVGLWVLARGFGIVIPLTAAYSMMACVVVGMMIPNSPGNVGTFWYFLLLPLAVYGIAPDDPQVALLGLTAYFMQLGQQSIFGIWFLVTGGVRLGDLSATAPMGDTAASTETG